LRPRPFFWVAWRQTDCTDGSDKCFSVFGQKSLEMNTFYWKKSKIVSQKRSTPGTVGEKDRWVEFWLNWDGITEYGRNENDEWLLLFDFLTTTESQGCQPFIFCRTPCSHNCHRVANHLFLYRTPCSQRVAKCQPFIF
jgi:hypothetical protein